MSPSSVPHSVRPIISVGEIYLTKTLFCTGLATCPMNVSAKKRRQRPDTSKSQSVDFNCTFQADAVILCYSIADRNSFVNVEYKWWRELQKPICRRRVPIILVGTKSDLRKCNPVTTGEGIQLCNRINARAFLECSASTQTNIAEVIYESVRAAVRFSDTSNAAAVAQEDTDEEEEAGKNSSHWYEEEKDEDDDSDADDIHQQNNVVGICLGQGKRRSGSNLRCKRNSFRLWFRKCF